MFIGIGGCSRSGKTTLTHRIKDIAIALDLRFKCIHQDDLLLPDDQLAQIKGRVDWEKPETIDSQKQQDIIEDAFTRKDIIVIEGIFIHPAFTPQLDKFIYLEIDKSEFFERRKDETRWGIEEEWYLEHVWESHQNFYRSHISNTVNLEKLRAKNIYDDYLKKLILNGNHRWKVQTKS